MIRSVKKDQSTAKRSDFLPVCMIAVAWIVMAAAVNPLGEFPLNDDFAYIKAVQSLVETGELKLMNDITMTLVGQLLWGWLFCLVFGFSIMTLRLSTLILGLVGLLAVYWILRELKASRATALLGVSVIALNAMYFQLSSTFMTDVPFLAVTLLSIAFYIRALKSDSLPDWAAATLIACFAILIRQTGIILPISFAIAYLARGRLSAKSAARAIAPTILVLVTQIACHRWLSDSGKLPEYCGMQAGMVRSLFSQGVGIVLAGLIEVVRFAGVYLGLFLLPLVILLRRERWKSLSRRQRLVNFTAGVSFFAFLAGMSLYDGRWIPLSAELGNIIIDFGLGPITLCDISNLDLPYPVTAPPVFWIVLTMAGAVGGALVLMHLLAGVQHAFGFKAAPHDRAILLLLLSSSILHVASVLPLTRFAYFDRYYLCAIPLLVLLLVHSARNISWKGAARYVSMAILVGYMVFALAGTHDYLAWNRARWQAADSLMSSGQAKPDQINGGWGFNGWYNYRETEDGRWYTIVGQDYLLTFNQVYGFDEIGRCAFRRWMPYREDAILILRDEIL